MSNIYRKSADFIENKIKFKKKTMENNRRTLKIKSKNNLIDSTTNYNNKELLLTNLILFTVIIYHFSFLIF